MDDDTRAPSPDPSTTGRVDAARRRVRSLKVGAALAASGVFVATAAAARTAHPGGTAVSTEQPLDVPAAFQSELDSSSFFGSGDIGPAGGGTSAPRTQTRTS